MRLPFALAFLVSCGGPAPPERSAPPTPPVRATPTPEADAPSARVVLEPEGAPPVEVRVEVADTPAARQRGLMFRRHMPRDAGMLFIFPRAEPRSFWMRNTFLALDILFIGADRRVVGVVEHASPLTDDSRAVEADSQYVLEVHAGFARTHSLSTGTPVRFTGLPEE
ncbi:MAG: DUF192 domain-containing protein [Sandaracinaceae bacterium]